MPLLIKELLAAEQKKKSTLDVIPRSYKYILEIKQKNILIAMHSLQHIYFHVLMFQYCSHQEEANKS